jgi:hypothetical protein
MAKNTPTRFIQNEISKGLILCDPIALFPKRLTGGWQHAAYNDISHLTFGMAGYDMNCFWAAHFGSFWTDHIVGRVCANKSFVTM